MIILVPYVIIAIIIIFQLLGEIEVEYCFEEDKAPIMEYVTAILIGLLWPLVLVVAIIFGLRN